MATISGVWVFNELTAENYDGFIDITVNFTSNGENFVEMGSSAQPIVYIRSDGSYIGAFVAGSTWHWADEAYRTVDFGVVEQEVSDDFYAWFTTNATKQEDSNPEQVYDSVYFINTETLVGIGDAIREKTGTNTRYTPAQMEDGVNEVFEAGKTEGYSEGQTDGIEQGKQAEQERFWDAYQNNGGNYRYAFANNSWTDDIYNPKHNIVCTQSAEHAFADNATITDTKVPIEVRGCSANYMFKSCTNLKTIPFIGFYGVTSNTTFMAYSYNLEDITFDGEIVHSIGFANCSKLTNESVQSIIDHLADLTGQTSVKITWHATVGANMTEEQKAAMTAKNWTFTY